MNLKQYPSPNRIRRVFVSSAATLAVAFGVSACGGDSLEYGGSGIDTILTTDNAINLVSLTDEVVLDIGFLKSLEQFSLTAAALQQPKDSVAVACTSISTDPQCTGSVTYTATFPVASRFDRFPANSFYSEQYQGFQAQDLFGGVRRTVEIRYDFLTDFPTRSPFSGRMVLAFSQTEPSVANLSANYEFDNIRLIPAGGDGARSLSGIATTTHAGQNDPTRYDFRGWSTGIKTVGAIVVIEQRGLFSTGGTGFVDIRVAQSVANRTVYEVSAKAAAGARPAVRFVTEERDAQGNPTFTAS